MTTTARPRSGDPPLTPELVRQHGLTAAEFDRIRSILGREPTFVELGIFSALWSEHCSYKHSRPVLKTFPTAGPQVLQGPGRERRRRAHRPRAGPSPSRSSRTTTRRPWSPTRARRPAWAASCATSSPWARGPSRVLDSLRFGPLERDRQRYLMRGRRARHRRLRQLRRRARPSAATSPSTERLRGQSARQRDVRGRAARGRADPRPGRGPGQPDHRRGRAHRARRHPRRVVRVRRAVERRARPGGRRCRWATRSPRSCCSRPRSS